MSIGNMGCKGAMDIDLPTEAGPTEETVDALMEYLVGPLLPLKHTDFAKETPSESKQNSVAKQVHAAVVLYNYYHLNYHQETELLKFDQFCKLATVLKPGILHHMKYTCQSDHTVLNDPENQLSITEKAIMDACTISETLLNASTNISNVIKEWQITKVAVLLIDSKKENCFLQFNNGVWSVIEKEVYSESKKRKKIMTEYDLEGEVGFQMLAFSAVKDVAGIAYRELKILESHVVYSLSQAKTATRFFIVQSTQKISEDNLVPIQDVISSLQGPVVKSCLGSWVITPVVEYYYLLPYAEILSNLFSSESNVSIIEGSQKSCEKESGSKKVSDILQNKSKLISEIVNNRKSSEEKPHDSKDSKMTYKSDQCGEKDGGQSKEVFDNLQKKSKLDSETVHISNSSKEEPRDSKDRNFTYQSNRSSEKESGQSKEVSDNSPKKSILDSETVHISNSSKEEPHDSKDRKFTYQSNRSSEKESDQSKEVSDNLPKKSKLDSETVHISNSSTEEPHDSKDRNFTYQSNRSSEKESDQSKEVSDNLPKKSKLDSETLHISKSSKEEPHDSKASETTCKSNQFSEKDGAASKEVSDNLPKKSKLDSETVHISNSSKEEPHYSKASETTCKSNQCSEKDGAASKEVSENLQKKSKSESENVHNSSSSKEESQESKVSKNGYESNQFSSTFEPVSNVADDAITSQFISTPVDQKVKDSENSIGTSISVSNDDGMKQEDMNGSCKAELNDSSSGENNKIDTSKLLVCFQKENQNTKVQPPLKVYRHRKRSRSTNSTNSKAENLKDFKIESTISQSKDEGVNGEKDSCMVPPKDDKSLTVNYILDDFHSTVDAKKSALSEAALRALLYKRQKLYDQQQVIESELTLCDKKIQAIMHGGIGDCLGLKLEAVIDCCNEICKQDDMQTEQHTNQLVSRSSPVLSGKSLIEAELTLRKACQELDDICLSNNWMLPTYLTSQSDGGFVSNVTVKGADFECSGVSGNQPSIHEARNSAATHVIMRLQQMANGTKTAALV